MTNQNHESFISIEEAAKILKVANKTLRRWEKKGILNPARTPGGHRRYLLTQIHEFKKNKGRSRLTQRVLDKKIFPEELKLSPPSFVSREKEPVAVESFSNTSPTTSELIQKFVPQTYSPTRTRRFPLRFMILGFISTIVIVLSLGYIGLKMFAAEELTNLVATVLPKIKIASDKQSSKLNVSSLSNVVIPSEIVGQVLAATSYENLEFKVNVPSIFAQTVAANGGQLTTTSTTFNLLNETATTINVGGGATILSLGATTGTTTINNSLTVDGTTNDIAGTLNLSGNTLTASGDLTVNPTGGAVNVGTGTAGSADLAGGDLFVTGDLEVDGTSYIPTLSINGDSFTDLTGTGLAISSGALTATLGTSIDSSEISNDTILEEDLVSSNTPTNTQLLSYNSSTGGFTWVDQSGGTGGWSDGGTLLSLTTTTDNVSIGGTTELGKLTVDGDTDETQLLVQGNGTQTTNLVVFENSAGTDLFLFNNTGDLSTYGTTLGLNNDADADNVFGLAASAGGSAGSDIYWGDDLLCDVSESNCGWATSASSPWTTTSNVVNLSTSTDNVTVGSATNLGKLAVDGDTDEVQFLIQGNGTQTSSLAVFEDSSGTDLLSLSAAGILTLQNGETIDNSSNNQINLGLGSSGTLLLTSGTTASITNSAGALALNAQATGLNLQADGSIDVNIAGGSGSTGCTIANSTGNLTCAGTVSGSNGTFASTLQNAYDNDANGSDTIIALTSADDSLIFRNPASSGTDTTNVLTLENLETGNADSSFRVLNLSAAGTFTTAGGSLTNYGGYFSNTSTESAGGNVLTNVGLYSTASGADNNYAAIFESGNVGIGDTTPSYPLEIGTSTSAINLIRASGTLTSSSANSFGIYSNPTISPSATATNRAYTGIGSYAFSDSANFANTTNLISYYGGTEWGGAGTMNDLTGFYLESYVSGGGTVTTNYGIQIVNPDVTSGTITNNYGINIQDQTDGATDYGLAIAGADTQVLWLSSGADNTDAANGIGFGSSRDTNLYRSAANTLATDDNFIAALDITASGGDINGVTGESIDLGEATADTLTFTTGASTELILNTTNMTPGAAEGNVLGSATAEWQGLFLGDDEGILFGLDQDWTIAYDEATDDRLEITAAAATGFAVTTTTGVQTHTSSVVTGTTTTSGFVFDATALTTGTGLYLTSDSITQGKLFHLATTGNTLTTGTLFDLETTATSLTGTANVGSLADIEWEPGSALTATGDLVRINIGTNGTTTGDLFSVQDTDSDLFAVSETTITSSLPHSFTAAGDVAVAYDLVFTNQTASYIKSNAPLYIQTGESFENNNLSLQTYGTGTVLIEKAGTTVNSGATDSLATINLVTPIDTSGTQTHNGLLVSPTISNATAGTNTVNLLATAAVTGDAQVSLNALNIGTLTGTAATEYAINVGSGWDAQMFFNDTTSIVQLVDASTLTFEDASGNDMFVLADVSTSSDHTLTGDADTDFVLSNISIFTAANVTTFNCADCVDFDDIGDGLTLDADTTIASTRTGISLDLNVSPAGTGATPIGFEITPTWGVDATDQTLTGLNINPNTNSNADSGDTLRGINLANITATVGTETGINIGTGWDIGIQASSGIAVGAQQTLTADSATPSVAGGSHWITNNSNPTNYTNFTGGTTGHLLIIEVNDANTTFDCIGSEATINCGNLDIAAAAGDILTWAYDGTVWNLINWLDEGDTQTGADLAEFFGSDGSLEPGDVVEIDDSKEIVEITDPKFGHISKTFVKKATGNGSKAIGIVSTNPFSSVLSRGAFSEDEHPVPIALTGRVPLKVSTLNGEIKAGDALVASEIPGIAVKATVAGPTIARALEDFNGGQDDKIIALVDNSWYSPRDLFITTNGNIASVSNLHDDSELFAPESEGFQALLSNLYGKFTEKIKTGILEIATLLVPQLKTNVISPLSGDLAIKFDSGSQSDPANLLIQNETDQTVASIDSQGNATFSGELRVNKLIADEIISGSSSAQLTIEQVQALISEAKEDQSLLDQAENWETGATSSASLSDLALSNLFVTENAAVEFLSVNNSLVVGEDLVISSNRDAEGVLQTSLNSLYSPLEFQSGAAQPLHFMAGLVKIDTQGNLIVGGDLTVVGEISSTGLSLHSNDDESSLLGIFDDQGDQIAGISSSGSAELTSIKTSNLAIPTDPSATSSASVTGLKLETTASAGRAKILSSWSEIMIVQPKVTENSLIFITPTTPTQKPLYIKTQSNGSFVVGFDEELTETVEFNWWIVELAQAEE